MKVVLTVFVIATLKSLEFVSADSYINSNGCENIDGGGWKLVRHVSSSYGAMHPSADNLLGTDVYGTYDNDAQSINTWSIKFNDIKHNQFLFSYGDCSEWLVATIDDVIGNNYDGESGASRCILKSNRNDEPYLAKWYYRNGFTEDPWISTKDHFECRDNDGIYDPCMVYGEGSYSSGNHEYGFKIHNGGNVWIRYQEHETRNCYTNTNGCDEIDGGEWKLVRHVSSSYGTMHPAMDNLEGTDVYGIFDYNAKSSDTWSIKFNNIEFNQFLFSFGDCSKWLVATKDDVIGNNYNGEQRCILKSNRKLRPYTAEWYYRSDFPEDPWISTKDHDQCRDNYALLDPCMVYGENSYKSLLGNHEYGFKVHDGGNVWIRNNKDEKRSC